MIKRTTLLVGATSLLAFGMAALSTAQSLGPWHTFICYLALGVVSACFKVRLPGGHSSLSFNVPYILLSLVWLPLPAALLVAATSGFMICIFRVSPPNSPEQILLNVANITNSTAAAWFVYRLTLSSSGQILPSLVLAAVSYFAINSLTVAGILALVQSKPLIYIWKQFFWSVPYYALGALLATFAHYVELRKGLLTSQMVLPLVYLIYCICRSFSGRLAERNKHAADMAELHLRTIEALALAIEAKDQNTHDHLCRVRVYASGIAEELRLSEVETSALMAAALLHDIGKLAVPEYIINKPGKLTPEEFERMKIHPVVGAQILERVAFPYPVVPIVRSHHEQWNGCGYPDGLKGEEIPIGARILSAVDCFDALASDRAYRRALPLPETVEHLRKLAGIQFDPDVVRVLIDKHEELEARARYESSKMEALQTDIVVRKGEAPSAGFESSIPMRDAQNAGSVAVIARTRIETELTRIIREALQEEGAENVLSSVAAALAVLIPFDMMMVYVREGKLLRPYFISTEAAPDLFNVGLPIGEGLCGWVAQSRRSLLNGNPSTEIAISSVCPGMARMHAALAVPLINEADSVIGVLALYHAQQNFFNGMQISHLKAVQPAFTSFLERVTQAPSPRSPQSVQSAAWHSADLANVG